MPKSDELPSDAEMKKLKQNIAASVKAAGKVKGAGVGTLLAKFKKAADKLAKDNLNTPDP